MNEGGLTHSIYRSLIGKAMMIPGRDTYRVPPPPGTKFKKSTGYPLIGGSFALTTEYINPAGLRTFICLHRSVHRYFPHTNTLYCVHVQLIELACQVKMVISAVPKTQLTLSLSSSNLLISGHSAKAYSHSALDRLSRYRVRNKLTSKLTFCLLYTSDAADE